MKSSFLAGTDGKSEEIVRADWQKSAAVRCTTIGQRIPREWRLPEHLVSNSSPIQLLSQDVGFLSNEESRITELRAVDLLRALRSGSLKAFEVTLAFCKRAAIAHQIVAPHFFTNFRNLGLHSVG